LAALGSSYAFAAGTCGGTEQGKPDPAVTSKTGASAELKAELPGVDISALTAREKAEWAVQVNELLAPCPDVPVSIAQCVREKRACKTCLPAAQFMAKQVRRGLPKEARAEFYKMRFDPEAVKSIEIGESPSKGPADAAVTIVEWADFQCPGCQQMGPFARGDGRAVPRSGARRLQVLPARREAPQRASTGGARVAGRRISRASSGSFTTSCSRTKTSSSSPSSRSSPRRWASI
jgi:hypothetical protein